jgi:hypothetical protein
MINGRAFSCLLRFHVDGECAFAYFANVSKRLIVFIAVLFACHQAVGQRGYATTGSEYIFSFNQTRAADSIDVDGPARFSLWFNTGVQYHYDFGKAVGIYTGLSVRNVGMITRMDSLKLKHRAYAVGVPLALKLGNTSSKWTVSPGAEAEFMVHYKVKEFIRGKKVHKHGEWLSDDVNLFNPSVFVQLNFGGNAYVKFKYYLDDFLKPVDPDEGYRLHKVGAGSVPAYTQESKLFYVSFGANLPTKKKRNNTGKPTTPPWRWNRSRQA